MSNEDIKKDAEKLVDFLESSKGDKGVMADIRAAASEKLAYRAWPHIAKFGGINTPKAFAVRIISHMYSVFPEHSGEAGNFGETVKKIEASRKKGEKKDNDGDSDGRMRYLLAADRSEISKRLRKFCGFLKNVQGLKVNYVKLYEDLIYWSDTVKERWADSYYNFKS